MGRVRVFGGILATDRSLPGLPVAAPVGDGQCAIRELRTRDADGPIGLSDTVREIGHLAYANGIVVTLGACPTAAEIVITDTGRFTLDDAHQVITHTAPPDVDRSAVALDLIGVVLPYAFHREGAWCMHASAVQTPGGVIAFVAPRGTGKSTLAAACVQAGCALVADDVVVLRESSDGVTVTPSGVPLRLRAETARAVGVPSDDPDAWGKVRIAAAMAQDTLPLAAIYVLQPLASDAPVARAPRTGRAAALALLANGKITALLGGDAAGDALSRCAALAQQATVFDLAVPRDLPRLRDVVTQLVGWHAATSVAVGA
jgi:hypothetical protein